jgi:hypothetical protein
LTEYLSGKKSRPRATSRAVFAAPTNGIAFNPVSSAPLMTPFLRIVATTVASAIAPPIHGIERLRRRDIRRPPQRVILFAMVM